MAGLHREALGTLVGRRAADYLASELRGQLLARDVHLVVEDRLSRGLARKIIPVRPPQFLGERLEDLSMVDVPGFTSIRLEIYFSGEDPGDGEPRGIAVYAAGTLVANSFQELAALGLDHAPGTDLRLTGLVDFPDFRVAPGSRHGVLVDEAADAFAHAIARVEPVLQGLLDSFERRRAEKLDRSRCGDLQRAFRDFYRQRPRYALDEPTSGLDPVFRRELLEIFSGLIQDENKSILFSTHITSDLERIADFITFIKDGSTVFSEAKDLILDNWAIVKGGSEILSDELKPLFCGIRKYEYGFEALTSNKIEIIKKFKTEVTIEKPQLEDIMFLMTNNNGGKVV